jgi:hypothetical protein
LYGGARFKLVLFGKRTAIKDDEMLGELPLHLHALSHSIGFMLLCQK